MVTTLSPWDRGPGLEQLRPSGRTALILVDFHLRLEEAITDTVPSVEATLATEISAPVRARAASYAGVARAIQDVSIEVTRRGEAIVAPILLIVLLLVFRSPIAAAIPLAFGATTVIASRGLMSIASNFLEISGFALSIASMIGLALGVDYALLIVSRFREELAAGADPVSAATATRRSAGRTTVFAGSTLLISMLVAVFLVPGALLVSLCSTVVAVIVLAVAGPWVVGPAILVLLGRNIDRWRIGRRRPTATRWLAISRGALRNPRAALLASTLALLLISAPALSLATGPLTIEQLPEDDSTRLDVEAIEAAVGGGWIAPSVLVAGSDRGPITQARRLAALNRWQATAARDPGVAAVVGPGPLVRRVSPLRRIGNGFLGDTEGRLGSPIPRLRRATSGIASLRRGLGRASQGAHALTLGSDRAQRGASLVAEGLALAAGGGERADRALGRFSRGARRLAAGQQTALLGASLLAFGVEDIDYGIDRALPEARENARALRQASSDLAPLRRAAAETVSKLEAAWAQLADIDVAADPRLLALQAALREALTAATGTDPVSSAPFAPGYAGLPAGLESLAGALGQSQADAEDLRRRLGEVRTGVHQAEGLTRRLRQGIERLQGGSRRLAGGSDRIAGGAARLGRALGRLDRGAGRLAGGLARLRDGNAALARGLSFAFGRTLPLARGARRASAAIVSSQRRLRRTSPGLFDSGYFVLSALDGAPARTRNLAGQAIDLETGGQAAQILVVSDHGLDDPAVVALDDELRRSGRALAEETGLEVAVTGGVAQTTDYTRATSARLPILVVTITLITFLAMIAILRALPLAAIAIALNLLTVAAAFGVLELLTHVPENLPLGGTGHIDPVGAAGIFGVVFGLSIDYSVFLLMRMREHWERNGDNEAAIAYGLERTAVVITGAATIMAVVFGVFATAPIDTVAQFGIGLTVAIMLDATVIRLMLLPVLMKLIGPRVWWIPAPLVRLLPKLDVHGGQR